MRIGVFDSGIGGLAIFKHLLHKLPQHDYVYLGDNARVPYGSRSPRLIYQFTREAVDFLFDKNCALIILACNTATGAALHDLQIRYLPEKYPKRKILGVIRPAVEQVLDAKLKKVAVLGTYSTIESRSFEKEIHKFDPTISVIQIACPLLASFVEEGEMKGHLLDTLLTNYMRPLRNRHVDGVVLGCTHYELVKREIAKHFPKKVTFISEGPITAEKLSDYLQRHPEIDTKLSKKSQRTFYLTDFSERYRSIMQLFLGTQHLVTPQIISL